jgi:hypothetical protein
MKLARLVVALVSVASAGAGVACGGGAVAPGPGDGGGTDATLVPLGAGDAGGTPEAATPVEGGAGAEAGEDGGGASTCAPPGVATNSALCVTVSPEAIAFLVDPRFDGKGLMELAVYSSAFASDGDGGNALAPAVIVGQPDGGTADGGFALVDLSGPEQVVRFEVRATTAYVRAIFVDNLATLVDGGTLQAGWWIGGFDLTHGFDKAPLVPIALTAGQGTSATVDLVALRQLTVTATRGPGVTPAGNGQGPLTSYVTNTNTPAAAGTYAFGAASSPCANVSGLNQATVLGWVVGDGPYWISATLDDFGVGGSVPGGLFALEYDGGVLTLPAADRLSYPANAYQVRGDAVLTLVGSWDGGADADTVSCP